MVSRWPSAGALDDRVAEGLGEGVNILFLRRLIELLDVGQVENAPGRGRGDLTLVDAKEIPVGFPFRRDEAIFAEDLIVPESFIEAVEDDEVGGDQDELRSVTASVLGTEEVVEVLPDDGHGHDEGLAGARRHFEAVLRPVVGRGVEREADAEVARKGIKIVVSADFVNVDEGFDGFPLSAPEAEFAFVGEEMVLLEPEFKEALGDGAGAFVGAIAPGPRSLLNLLV